MRDRYRIGLTLITILVMGVTLSQVATGLGQPPGPPRPPFDWDIDPEDLEQLRRLMPIFFTVKAAIQTLNSVLILGIVLIHVGIYRRTGAKFSLGLVVFSTALLLYTIMANPLVYGTVGFRRIGFGPILLIPDVLTLVASAILIYLSRK
jgi:hypothetical protein